LGAARAVLVNSNLGTSRFFILLARLTKTTDSASREARDQGVFDRGQSQQLSAVRCLSPDTLIFPELASDRLRVYCETFKKITVTEKLSLSGFPNYR
jgi:hypothetical protein